MESPSAHTTNVGCDGEEADTVETGTSILMRDSSSQEQPSGQYVLLRSNPMDLPMVCGICGNQYATSRGMSTIYEHV